MYAQVLPLGRAASYDQEMYAQDSRGAVRHVSSAYALPRSAGRPRRHATVGVRLVVAEPAAPETDKCHDRSRLE